MPVDVERCIHAAFLSGVASAGTVVLWVLILLYLYLVHIELSTRNVSLTFGGESVLKFENLTKSFYKPNRGLRSGH